MKRPCMSINADWHAITVSMSLYASLHSSMLPPTNVTPRWRNWRRTADIVNRCVASARDMARPAPCDAEFNDLSEIHEYTYNAEIDKANSELITGRTKLLPSEIKNYALDYLISMNLENSIDFKVERRKSLNPESISEDEAAVQLELLNHSFYIFRNKDLQDKICVLYRREIGYGLITID